MQRFLNDPNYSDLGFNKIKRSFVNLKGNYYFFNDIEHEFKEMILQDNPIYKHNTKLLVIDKKQWPNYQSWVYLRYNRVDIGNIFRNLSINIISLNGFTEQDIRDFFKYRADMKIEQLVDIEVVDGNDGKRGFWIRAKPNNYIFYGEAFVTIIDRRKVASEVIKHNILTIAPENLYWVSDEHKLVDFSKTTEINDLRIATSWLGINRNDLEQYDTDIINNFHYLSELKVGSFAEQPHQYGLFVTELLLRFNCVDGWGFLVENDDNFTGEINIAKCDILYNGKSNSEEVKDWVNPIMVKQFDKLLVFKPSKTHKIYNNHYTRFATIYYN